MSDDLPDDQRDALVHWSMFGQPGAPVTERFIPDADERLRLKPFVSPASGVWLDRFDAIHTERLVRGFPWRDMEDKWVVWSDDSRPGWASVHFHRSWTGAELIRIDLELTDTGSLCRRATWEMDPGTLTDPSEAFARETFLEITRWVLGMRPND